MNSIFNLATSTDELSSANQGTSRLDYEQHPPTRDVTGDNFPNGAIHHRWQTSGQKWWLPSRSYMRMRVKLTKNNGAPLDLADQVAPNYGLMANLFQSCEFRMNDKTISRVSDFLPQVDALETRLSKSRSWMKSIGVATNWWNDDFKERLSEVSVDGVELANTPPTAPVVTTRVADGFDAATNTIEIKDSGEVEFQKAGGGDLPDLSVDPNYAVGRYLVLDTAPHVPRRHGWRHGLCGDPGIFAHQVAGQ